MDWMGFLSQTRVPEIITKLPVLLIIRETPTRCGTNPTNLVNIKTARVLPKAYLMPGLSVSLPSRAL